MREEELISGNIYYINYNSNDSYLFKCEKNGNVSSVAPFIRIDTEKMNPKSFYTAAVNLSNNYNSSFRGKEYIAPNAELIDFYNKCAEANKIVEYKFNKQQESFIDLIF